MEPTKRLIVRGINSCDDLTRDNLLDDFEGSTSVDFGKKGNEIVAYITFSSVQAAESAKEDNDNFSFMGSTLDVSFAARSDVPVPVQATAGSTPRRHSHQHPPSGNHHPPRGQSFRTPFSSTPQRQNQNSSFTHNGTSSQATPQRDPSRDAGNPRVISRSSHQHTSNGSSPSNSKIISNSSHSSAVAQRERREPLRAAAEDVSPQKSGASRVNLSKSASATTVSSKQPHRSAAPSSLDATQGQANPTITQPPQSQPQQKQPVAKQSAGGVPWWINAEKPKQAFAPTIQGIPEPPPAHFIETPEETTSLRFFPIEHETAVALLPQEAAHCVQDLLSGRFKCCYVGPASPNFSRKVRVVNLDGMFQHVDQIIRDSKAHGAPGLSAVFHYGTSLYIADVAIAREVVSVTDFKSMIDNKYIAHIFSRNLYCNKSEFAMALGVDENWKLSNTCEALECVAENHDIALFTINKDDEIVPDTQTIDEVKAASLPLKLVEAEKLEQIAKKYKLNPQRRVVPANESEASIFRMQYTRRIEHITHPSTWACRFTTASFYNSPSDANPKKHHEIALTRRHLSPTNEGLSGVNVQEYACGSLVVHSLGRTRDFQMIINEVTEPAIKDAASVESMAQIAASGLNAARAISYDLPLFHPKRL